MKFKINVNLTYCILCYKMSSKITTTLSQNSTHVGFECKYHCITNNSTPQNDLDKYLSIEVQN